MQNVMLDAGIEIFSTCPQSSGADPTAYVRNVVDVARWSEQAGCRGILVYTDNSLVDPWLVSQIIIQQTESLCPLVAVQPAYMHPYAVAKMVATFGYLHGRRLYLNMVAGGFRNDLLALNDTTPHDKRYDRLREYTLIITRLLTGGPVSLEGEFYTVNRLRLTPALHPELMPGIFDTYMIRSYTPVADELARYIIAAYHTFILDIPPEEGELHHTNIAFSRAREQMAS